MMKSVGEIASKIWPVVYYLTRFGEILILTFDLDQRSRSSALGCIKCVLLGCTLVPGMKSVGEIASSLVFYQYFGKFDIGTLVIECALLGCTLVPSMKSVGEIASEI